MAYCPKCGASNEEQASYCQRCGGQLVVSPSAPKRAPAVWNMTSFDRTFKAGGPLLKTFLGIIFVLLVMEIFDALSGESPFAGRFSDFLEDNLLLFFFVFLLAFYFGFMSRGYPRETVLISPLVTAIVITFSLWVLGTALEILGDVENESFISAMGEMLFSVLYIIFLLIILLGYIGIIMRADRLSRDKIPASAPVPPIAPPVTPVASPVPPVTPPLSSSTPGKRLMRSNRDKILLGVCGGLAEYIGTDPFLVRVLWAVGIILSAGVFALAYLVLAVIMPKAP